VCISFQSIAIGRSPPGWRRTRHKAGVRGRQAPPSPQLLSLFSSRGRRSRASRHRAERVDDRRDCSDLGRRRCGDHCPRDAWVRNDEGSDDPIYYDDGSPDAHGTADVEHPDLFDRPTQRWLAYLRPIHGQLFEFCGHLPVFLDGPHERSDGDQGSSRWARPARRKPDDGQHDHRDLSTSDRIVACWSTVSAVRPSGCTRRRSRLLDQLQVWIDPRMPASLWIEYRQ
jgi:hypothetical protein